MASQPSDRLKAILAEARGRAEASRQAAAPTPGGGANRVDALLDRNQALPHPRALARLYQDSALLGRLPEDEGGDMPGAPSPAQLYSPPAPTPATAPGEPPVAAPLSRAQIRAVMDDLRQQFPSSEYQTYAAKVVPDEVISPGDQASLVATSEPSEVFFVLGTVAALVVIVAFVLLAVSGPLRYHAPANTPGSTPASSAAR